MSDVEPDLQIPGYRILRELGRGGMAKVYLAVQESMEREVALKVMLPALGAGDSTFSDRFLREARIVAKLSHPNIIAVIDVGVAGIYHYYSMEYHTGGDLKSRIHAGMMPKMALAITRQITSALAFAHAKGYIHRDVKPENVIFRQDGTALLTDFGIAKAAETATRMTATGAVIGTPHYMSPEQAQGSEIDQRSDLYSIGIMLYEMLTGSVPYTGNSALSIGIKHLKEPVPALPPTLNQYQPLIEKFLAKNPDDRFQNGAEAVAAIDAHLSGTHPTISYTPTVVAGSGATSTSTLAPTQITSPAVAGGSRKKLVVALAAIPVVAIVGYFGLRALKPAPVPVAATAEPAAGDSQNPRVAQLLAEADVAALAGRYLEPREQSAVAKYRQVLEIEADNTRARNGLREIASQLVAQAELATDKKNFDQAEILLRQAETADINHPLLASRRQALKDARAKKPVLASAKPPVAPASAKPPVTAAPAPTPVVAAPAPAAVNEAQQREQRLTSLMQRMQELLSPASLTTIKAGLALDLYHEAAKLAPDDARVRNAPNQIADAYFRLAAKRAAKKEYAEAEPLIRRGLELAPNHGALTSLQQEITDRQKTSRPAFGTF
jgi:serine/threonine-protein kinase PpkA